MSFAYLSLDSKSVQRELVITGYSFSYSASIQSAQSRLQLNHYPYRAAQKSFHFTIKCRNEEEWQDLKELIKAHQYDVLTQSITSKGFFRIVWPEQGWDYIFLIKASPGGAQRFQVSPVLSISAEMIYDNIFSETNKFFDPGADFNTLNSIVDPDQFIKPIQWTNAPPPATIPFAQSGVVEGPQGVGLNRTS